MGHRFVDIVLLHDVAIWFYHHTNFLGLLRNGNSFILHCLWYSPLYSNGMENKDIKIKGKEHSYPSLYRCSDLNVVQLSLKPLLNYSSWISARSVHRRILQMGFRCNLDL